jgi:hypothetical protein
MAMLNNQRVYPLSYHILGDLQDLPSGKRGNGIGKFIIST